MEPKTETITGVITVTASGLAGLMHEVYPFITFIAVLSGAILGCHGVFHLVRNWWIGKDTPPTRPDVF